jgi:hypothetical protein
MVKPGYEDNKVSPVGCVCCLSHFDGGMKIGFSVHFVGFAEIGNYKLSFH